MVIARAKEIANQLSDNDIMERIQDISVDFKDDGKTKKTAKLDDVDLAQLSLFAAVKDEDIIEELKNMDLNALSPIDALNELYRLQNKLKNRW